MDYITVKDVGGVPQNAKQKPEKNKKNPRIGFGGRTIPAVKEKVQKRGIEWGGTNRRNDSGKGLNGKPSKKNLCQIELIKGGHQNRRK